MPNWKKVILSGSNAILAEITASGNLSGSGTATASYGLFTGSFGGDGSQLTNVPSTPFPFTGDALVTGSLIVSQSYTIGDTDSTALRVIGSGSVSQSGIFEVEGSAGPLFSVADGLDGVLMEVNNISGLPLFQVSSSNEVFVNRGNLTSGVTTATASFAYFTGSFQGDGSQLTNLPAASTPTLQQVTTEGNITDQGLIVSGSTIFKPNTSVAASIEFSTEAYSGQQNPTITLKNASGQKTVHIGHSINDGLFELYNSTETKVVSIQEHFQAFSPPGGLSSGYGTYFGVTSSISPSVASPDSYVKIAHDGYSGAPYSILQLNKTGTFAGSGSITLQGIMNTNNNSAPSMGITSVNGNRVVNFGGPGFVNAANVHNNYLKYGLQVGGDFTGNSSNMALTDGSLIMSGSTGGFSVKSVSSEAEIKTNNGATTLTLGTTSSFKRVTADSSKISGSGGLSVESSGSTVFEVIGSEGTLFSVDDDLDGTIFTANDKSGLPVLEASASGEVYIGKSPQSLYTTAVISSNNANVTQSIYGLDTSSYGGAFFEYTAHSGSNARAGNIMSVWNGSNLNFTETTTLDIGDTSDLIMQVAISQSQAQVQSYASRAGYNIKTIIRSI